jgi:hypothetical protein
MYIIRRSQWSLGLKHELFLLARTLRSWVGIPLKNIDVCIVCIYSVSVLFCVKVAALRRADSLS